MFFNVSENKRYQVKKKAMDTLENYWTKSAVITFLLLHLKREKKLSHTACALVHF